MIAEFICKGGVPSITEERVSAHLDSRALLARKPNAEGHISIFIRNMNK